MEEVKIKLINPLNGLEVDESITEKEGKDRGYFDLEFLLKYLEDDNEFVKYFVIDGKRVLVNLNKPYLNYKKSTDINHERVLNVEFNGGERKIEATMISNPLCAVNDDGSCCQTCGS